MSTADNLNRLNDYMVSINVLGEKFWRRYKLAFKLGDYLDQIMNGGWTKGNRLKDNSSISLDFIQQEINTFRNNNESNEFWTIKEYPFDCLSGIHCKLDAAAFQELVDGDSKKGEVLLSNTIVDAMMEVCNYLLYCRYHHQTYTLYESSTEKSLFCFKTVNYIEMQKLHSVIIAQATNGTDNIVNIPSESLEIIPDEEIIKYKKWLIPLHFDGDHFIICLIDFPNKTMNIYDSLLPANQTSDNNNNNNNEDGFLEKYDEVFRTVAGWLVCVFSVYNKNDEDFDPLAYLTDWKSKLIRNWVQQKKGSYDCALAISLVSFCLVHDILPVNTFFSDLAVKNFRNFMVYALAPPFGETHDEIVKTLAAKIREREELILSRREKGEEEPVAKRSRSNNA